MEKVMKLIDPHTGLMECKVCGTRKIALVKPDSNGKFYRGSWQCPIKCKLEEIDDPMSKQIRKLMRQAYKIQEEYEEMMKG